MAVEESEDSVELWHEKLKDLSPESSPLAWAEAMHHLGDAYQERREGDPASNLEAAIAAYQKALTVRTREAMPREWAETTVNLANAYGDHPGTDPAERLQRTVDSYKEALGVLTREDTPFEWAATLVNLGTILSGSGEDELVEQAVECFQQALEVLTIESYPLHWATTMRNLGGAYFRRLRGDPAENIDNSIAANRAALEVYQRETFPTDWASLLHNLAVAYVRRQHGGRTQNLELAIEACRLTLEVHTREALPHKWAQTLDVLGTAYLRRMRGDRAENVEEAIRCYELALEARTESAAPVAWAATQMNLATAFRNRVLGDRAENLEHALAGCRRALRIRTREAMPADWAVTMMNLGIVYTNRIRGDRTANLELSIEAYEKALEVQTREKMPVDWALTTMNLGTAWYYRVAGDPTENLERALAAYEATLEVRTREGLSEDWSASMLNLASTYAKRLAGDPAENVEKSIALYEEVLETQDREAMPYVWSLTAGNLASAYTQRQHGNVAESFEKARELFHQVLEVQHRDSVPFDWARNQANLGYVYAQRQLGERAENVERAIAAYEAALEVQRPELLPDNARRTAKQLGNLYAREGQWDDAARAFKVALQAAERLYQSSLLPQSLESEMAVAPDLVRRACLALARAGEPEAAALTLERGRALGLGQALERDRTRLEGIRTRHPKIYDAYQEATERLRHLESSQRAEGPADRLRRSFEALHEEALRARLDLEAAVVRIRELTDDAGFLALPEPADLERMVPPERPLLYLLTEETGSLALLVRRAPDGPRIRVEALWEDGFDAEALDALLVERDGDEVIGGYLPEQARVGHDPRPFRRVLEGSLARLEEAWLGRLAARLREREVRRVALIPAGRLAILPLHALLDGIEVSYLPSGRVGGQARRELAARRKATPRLVAVGDPPLGPPLAHARSELEEVTAAFAGESRTLAGEEATKEALLDALPGATHLHLASHADFDVDRPLDSALQLADGTWSLREILDRPAFDTVRLVVLSACQTGLAEWNRLPDEVVGLPAGFLQAGVPGVVATLWPVDDLSTALFMARFYRCHLGKNGQEPIAPAAALRHAQKWLQGVTMGQLKDELRGRRFARHHAGTALDKMAPAVLARFTGLGTEERPFSSPYDWAPFIYFGP